MDEDIKHSFEAIHSGRQGLLVSQLLEVQQHKTGVEKSVEWARNLQCLHLVSSGRKRRRTQEGTYLPGPKVLRRSSLSRDKPNSNYVAVSWCWEHSDWKNDSWGAYMIESSDGANYTPSKVRNIVLDRVTAYIKHHNVPGFWIDKECINQSDPEEREIAMQSMDLVYSMSDHPLGLLTRPIELQEHLNLLHKLLLGNFMGPSNHPDYPHFKLSISPENALDVLALLERIISDPWWERAWIFQEEYLSSVKMDLLIPHLPGLRKGRTSRVVGDLPGELEVNSADFRRESTLFCLAYLRKSGPEWQTGIATCEDILQKAASYKILYQYPRCATDDLKHKAMSSTIFADIGHRNITNPSDVLAIAANCCDYSVRLNILRLKETKCSLSLCMLTLYLLNGEILRNDNDDCRSISGDIFEYLKTQSLDSFSPPVRDKKLAFLKNCRFVDVRFSLEGIVTTGWLWKLYKEISTSNFSSPPPVDKKRSAHGLTRYERSRLLQLASELALDSHMDLVADLYTYLDEDLRGGKQQERSSKYHKDLMAKELVNAIKEGKKIQLGCLMGRNPYRGIFIRDSSREERLEQSYVFTAWKPRRRFYDDFGKRRSEKYVSLEVDLVGTTQSGLPLLETKRWVNGLYFFDGCQSGDVVFPWPASLRAQS
jgi:hypothetical protein